MFDIGFSELFLFGIIALIVLGPEKLPQAARTAGQWYGKLRRTVSTIQSEVEAELDLSETRKQLQAELDKIRKTEANMKQEMAAMRGDMREFESSQDKNLKDSYKSTSDKKEDEQAELEPVEHSYSYHQQPDTSSTEPNNNDSSAVSSANDTAQLIVTRPWENMWFQLGTYDKTRRLPAAPRLPNYQADILLHTTNTNSNNDRAQADLAVTNAQTPSPHSLHKPEVD